ncbi:MAG: hypothetical protein Q9205_001018, partial [Flavoplaca limonia]
MSTIDPNTTPALQPPPGVLPNFNDPYNTDSTINGTLGICIAISSIFVLLRLYTKLYIIRKYGWEDYTIFIAWLAFIAYCAVGWVAVGYGSGKHQWDVRLTDFFTWLKLSNALQIFYNPLIFITKLSILLQYLVIFVPNSTGKTYWAIHFVICVNLLFYLAVMLVQIFQCQPREKIWHPLLPGRCVDLAAVLISGAVINVISDLSILVLPVAKIWQLQMRTACIASIMRMVNNVQYAQTQDYTFRLTAVALWTLGEIASGMVCSCLPVVPAFFRHYMPKLTSSFKSSLGKVKGSRSGGQESSSKSG